MKNIFKFLFVIVMLFSASFASAQGRYDKGDVLLNLGFGLGYYYASGTPLLLSAEFAVNDVISVGPYLGYTSHSESASVFGSRFKQKWSFIDIGVRGSYHFNDLFEITNDKVDVYGGAHLGYLVSNYSYSSNIPNDPGRSNSLDGGLRLGIFAGVRYFFSEKVGGYGELGAGISPLALGLTFKL